MEEDVIFVMEWDAANYLSSGNGILSVDAPVMDINSDRVDTF